MSGSEAPSITDAELRTRDRLRSAVVAEGPITAAELAASLGLTASGVRRHLDALESAGFITPHQVATGRRGRGRPARAYVATAQGHGELPGGYDGLATDALRYLQSVAGDDAVRAFAERRVAALEQNYRSVVDEAGCEPNDRATALAAALANDGYAATTRPVYTDSGEQVGVQLCQGHCPVHQVAAEFPAFCDAETAAFSRLLGVHVQRLATLANGEHVCTTHVPQVAAMAERHTSGSALESDQERKPR